MYHIKLSTPVSYSLKTEKGFFIVGSLKGKFEFPDIEQKDVCLGDILEPYVDDKYTLSDKRWKWMQSRQAKHRGKGNGFGYGKLNTPDTKATRCLTARYGNDGEEILIEQEGKNPRKLTPRECARLMGFPNSYKITVSNTQAYKCFGNSVAVPIVERIAAIIRDSYAH